MIIVRFTSGLGNQMFQYNFYRLMQEMYPDVEVKADLKWMYRVDYHHGYELERVFPFMKNRGIAPAEATFMDCFRASGQLSGFGKNHKIAGIWSALTYSVNEKMRNGKYKERYEKQVIDNSGGELENKLFEMISNLDASRDYYITSYFPREEYYKDRLEKLVEEFEFDEPSDEINKSLLSQIDSCESVSIHMRRGDYLSKEYEGKFCILNEDYYSRAVDYMKEEVKKRCGDHQPGERSNGSLKFYIFSDDIPFARTFFKELGLTDAVYVDNNGGADSYRDMQLMSRCKHNIIANSTFSQWGALLNKNPDHIVIYPGQYLQNEDTQNRTLPGWVRL